MDAAGQSGITGEAAGERRESLHRYEVASAFLLGLSALSTSWASYQSALWSGVQQANYVQANALRVQSSRSAIEGGQRLALDVGMFLSWVRANSEERYAEAEWIRNHVRKEFAPAFEKWIAGDPGSRVEARDTPFTIPEYKVELTNRAKDLENQAAELFRKGQQANSTSDGYVLTSVIFSSAMFFIGISPQFNRPIVRLVLILLAAAMWGFGMVKMMSFPVL